jgi:hypothetical protein
MNSSNYAAPERYYFGAKIRWHSVVFRLAGTARFDCDSAIFYGYLWSPFGSPYIYQPFNSDGENDSDPFELEF